MEVKDVADLFANTSEQEAKERVEEMMEVAPDALIIAIEEAPEGSRQKLVYVKNEIIPLVMKLFDTDERLAAMDDVSAALKLPKKPLKNALATAEARERKRVEEEEHKATEADDALVPEEGTERYRRAMEILNRDDILDLAANTLERLGHVGEFLTKQICLVCAISAKAGFPVQPSTHAESSTGKNFLWDSVLDLVPDERIIKRSAISAKALFRTGANLKGAVLYLQEVAGSEDADFTIRVLQSDGKLTYESTEKSEEGQFETVVHEQEGPTVVVQTTTKEHLFHENETRVFSIHLDESKEQTERINQSNLKRAVMGEMTADEKYELTEPFQDAVRLLEPAPVKVPFAERIEVPANQVRTRRDTVRLLNVIRIIAWLHQFTRDRDDSGAILAEEADFYKAVDLVQDSLTRAWKVLSPKEEQVLSAVGRLNEALRSNGFRRSDISVDGVSDRAVQAALKSLSESGYLISDGRGGARGYSYTMNRGADTKKLGITLRDALRDEGETGATEGETNAQAGLARSGAIAPDWEEGDDLPDSFWNDSGGLGEAPNTATAKEDSSDE